MQVTVYKHEDGRRTVIVKKTRRDENPTRIVSNVPKDAVQETIKATILEVAPDATAEQIPLHV